MITRRLDELFLAWPFLRLPPDDRDAAGRRLGHQPQTRPAPDAPDGLTALGPKPQTSKPAAGHKIYPYLVRGLVIERANKVSAAAIRGAALHTRAGEVTLKVPSSGSRTFETASIERCRWRESSVQEAQIGMYLAGVSGRRVEDITEALWGTRVSRAPSAC